MKRTFLTTSLFLFCTLLIQINVKAGDYAFKYEIKTEAKINFVWGVEDWKTVPLKMRPANTVIENGVMHSAMSKKKGSYSISIKAPSNSVINYGILIIYQKKTGGTEYIWDGPYQSILTKDSFHIFPSSAVIGNLSKLSGIAPTTDTFDTSLVTSTIKYYFPKATEVEFAWGVNNWVSLPENIRPDGTYLQNNLMRTPMKNFNDTFIVDIQIPKGAILNYAFVVSNIKGHSEKIGIWDIKKDTLISSKLQIYNTPSNKTLQELIPFKTFPNIVDKALYLLLLVVFLYIILIKIKSNTKFFSEDIPSDIIKSISWLLSLTVILILIRGYTAGLKYAEENNNFLMLKNIITVSFYDVIYLLLIISFFLIIYYFIKKNLLLKKILYGIFITVCFLSLLSSILNIKAVEMLGTPFNYKWLYYSDFLESTDSKSALSENLSFDLILNILALFLCFILIRDICQSILLLARKLKHKKVIAYISSSVIILIYCNAYFDLKAQPIDKGKLENPIIAFVSSVIDSKIKPGILSIKVKPEYQAEFVKSQLNHENKLKHKKVKNVVLFVMESVSSKYVDLYTNKYNVTPNLSAYSSKSLIFEKAYAHAPSTNISMVSILAGIYPWISTKSITKEYPGINHPTISSELKKRNYRTSFFTSADNGFQNVGLYLSQREFDIIGDYKTGDCLSKQLIVTKDRWENPDGANDDCITSNFKNWVSEDITKPFFSVLWTYQTHYPYFLTEKEKDYHVYNDEFNRYLNALNHTDAIIGYLLKFLNDKKLMDSTLVIIVGDHGEAFQQHGQSGHASKLYEENIHIPMIFINPNLFSGEHNSIIAGHIDLGPTILSMLNIPSPSNWQGENLFTKQDGHRGYFFAPWSDYLFGYRDKDYKYIYNATDNTYEIYNLNDDPDEKNNLTSKLKNYEDEGQQHLAAWVQYQQNFMKKALN